jgi:hypothetical protein
VFLCFWHVKRAWLKNLVQKVPKSKRRNIFHTLGSIMLMLKTNLEQDAEFTLRVESALQTLWDKHPDQHAFIQYFHRTWGGKKGMPELLLLLC